MTQEASTLLVPKNDAARAFDGAGPSAGHILADTLRQLRLREGWSLRDVVRRLGYSAHSAIADFESGRRIPSEQLVQAYEKLFSVPPGVLVAQRRNVLAERAGSGTGRTSWLPASACAARPALRSAAQAGFADLRSAALALVDVIDHGNASLQRTHLPCAGDLPSPASPEDVEQGAPAPVASPKSLEGALLALLRAVAVHLCVPPARLSRETG